MPTTCQPTVEHHPGARYPHKPACSCGWTYRGFLTHDSAQDVADWHAEGEQS